MEGITNRKRSTWNYKGVRKMIHKSSGILICITVAALCFLPGCGASPHQILPPCMTCGTKIKQYVYTANAAGNPATVSALAADATTGALTSVSGSPYNAGSGATAIVASQQGVLYTANYFSGDIYAHSVNSNDGTLTAVSGFPVPIEVGVNAIAIDHTSTSFYAVSQRSAALYAFSTGMSGALTPLSGNPVAIGPGTIGASSVVVDPSGKYVYVTAADSFSANIYGFSRNTTTGALSPLPTFPIPVDGMSNHSTFDPTGHFLLVTGTGVFGGRGGVDVFTLDSATGGLTLVVGTPIPVGVDPAGVVIVPSGRYVYIPNTADATISAFAFDSTSGSLSPVAGSPFPSGGRGSINGPLGIAADNQNKFVFVCNASNDISVFSVGNGGVLTPVSGSPFPTGGNGPQAIVFVP